MRSLGRRKGSREPRYTRFSQQELPGVSGQPGPWQAALVLALAGAALIALGGAALSAAASVTAVGARYDGACPPSPDPPAPCALVLPPLPRPLAPPVHLHYALTRFHQNHRRYARSRWDAQLRGDGAAASDPAGPALDAACAPRAREAPGGAPLVPCGLVAWSAFNDTFAGLQAVGGGGGAVGANNASSPLPLDETGIAWRGDGPSRFGGGAVWASPGQNGDPATRGGRRAGTGPGGGPAVVPLAGDEHLQVWMRPAALPSFRKPWGIVRDGPVLPAGTRLTLSVRSAFNSAPYGGAKSVVLTSTSWLGGANFFTGWALVGVGGAHGLAALGLAGVGWARGRRGRAGAWAV